MLWEDRAGIVASIVHTAGGELVGRTRLQKMAYLMKVAGWECEFPFRYYHYGPYSEELAEAANNAILMKLLKEKTCYTPGGNPYSVYSELKGEEVKETFPREIQRVIEIAAQANSIELELAATALFLAREEKCTNPWEETARRKPQKTGNGFLERAGELYRELRACAPESFPDI